MRLLCNQFVMLYLPYRTPLVVSADNRLERLIHLGLTDWQKVERMDDATIDQLKREIALLRGAHAPVIYCNGLLSPEVGSGVAGVTLAIAVSVSMSGEIVSGTTPVAHLRFPMAFIPMLRKTLDEIELLAKPAASGEKN